MRRRDLLLAPFARAGRDSYVLVHEHVMVDFVGAEAVRPGRYEAEEVFQRALPKLEEVKRLGCGRLLECTPNYLGRDARLMRRLEEASGVEIWTNTGLYGAAGHKYVPKFAWEESAEQLARRWVQEWRRGVEGVKPRFIKSGVNKGPLDEMDRKLTRAAALTVKETGLTAAIHTGDGKAAEEEAEIFEKERVSLGKLVWVHAQNERDGAVHERMARAGAWVEFDGVNERSADWHRECVGRLAERGLIGRVLISQDSGWYRVGEPGGGEYRGYGWMLTDFLPTLERAWVRTLMVENPRRAFGR